MGLGSPCPQLLPAVWTRFPGLETPRTPRIFPSPPPVFLILVSARASFPTPRPPSCLSLPAFSWTGRSLPSSLAELLHHSLLTDGQGGAAPASGRLGSGALGEEGLKGSGVRALGK